MGEKASLQKICSDPKCQDEWAKMDQAAREAAAGFTYCPFCAEELATQCSACCEQVQDPSFKFCPWCGKEFEK